MTSKRKIKRICIICNKSFISAAVNTKICSKNCYNVHSQNRRKKIIRNKNCLNCGKDFSCWKLTTKFCSKSCGSLFNIEFGNGLKGLEYGHKLAQKNKRTLKDFIKKSELIHGNKYTYQEVNYVNNTIKVKINCSLHGVFLQTPKDHLVGKGCPKCIHRISNPETKWLNEQSIAVEYRQYKIVIDNKRFNVDGYDPKTNTVYEFLGDFWHGNPKKYKSNETNKRVKKTFGKLHQETVDRIKLFRYNGFNVKYIWESDYKKLKGNSI